MDTQVQPFEALRPGNESCFGKEHQRAHAGDLPRLPAIERHECPDALFGSLHNVHVTQRLRSTLGSGGGLSGSNGSSAKIKASSNSKALNQFAEIALALKKVED
jgi:hypothetical protein